MAAGTDGLRAAGGGNAACWRVAGAIAAPDGMEGAEVTGAADVEVVLAGVLAAVLAVVVEVVFAAALSAVFSVVSKT